MPSTPTFGLRYPASADSPDVPRDVQNLATDTDTQLGKTVNASTPPSAANQVPIWNGTAWTYGKIAPVNMAAAGGNRRFLASDDSGNPLWQSGGLHLIARPLAGSAVANIDISSIPQTFGSLVAYAWWRGTGSGTQLGLGVRLNGDTGTNYSWSATYCNGTAVTSLNGTSQTQWRIGNGVGATTDQQYSSAVLIITRYTVAERMSYTATSGGYDGTNFAQQSGGRYHPSALAPITRLTFIIESGASLDIGSTVSLWGIG